MKISKILRLAADEYLQYHDAADEDDHNRSLSPYSCDAFNHALEYLAGGQTYNWKVGLAKIEDFVYTLGLDRRVFNAFLDDFEDKEDRQGARFLWLDFAALVAEDMENKGELDEINC